MGGIKERGPATFEFLARRLIDLGLEMREDCRRDRLSPDVLRRHHGNLREIDSEIEQVLNDRGGEGA